MGTFGSALLSRIWPGSVPWVMIVFSALYVQSGRSDGLVLDFNGSAAVDPLSQTCFLDLADSP
jgi:hypothetical protein